MTDSIRTIRGRIGAHALHAKHDSREITAPARAAFLDRFAREVDPDGKLDPLERARRASHARRAYFTRLALKSAKARRDRKQRRRAPQANAANKSEEESERVVLMQIAETAKGAV